MKNNCFIKKSYTEIKGFIFFKLRLLKRILIKGRLNKIDNENLSIEQIIQKNDDSKLIIAFSHTNFLKSNGGTEKFLYEQMKFFHSKGYKYIHIFPKDHMNFLNKSKCIYGVNVNEKFIGFTDIHNIVKLLELLKENILSCHIHHLLYWQFSDIKILLHILIKNSEIKTFYYVHDLYTICPNIMKKIAMEGNKAKCILPMYGVYKQSICSNCMNCYELRLYQEKMGFIFDLCNKIVVPSEVIFNIFKTNYARFSEKVSIHGHLKLANEAKVERVQNSRMRLAYFGAKATTKGWETWVKLYNNEDIIDIYELFHIGKCESYSEKVAVKEFNYREYGNMAAVNTLVNNNIDMVLLWSTLPESYSYTLHEALAAGVPILTNNISGNIYNTIKEKGASAGKVFPNEEELISFLLNKDEVEKLINTERYRYTLEFNEFIS